MEASEISEGGQEYFHRHEHPLPSDEEAERAVLALLLRDSERLDEISHQLAAEDFYTQRHQLIYEHIALLKNTQGRPADLVTVQTSLADAKVLDKVGGIEYLSDLESLGELATNFNEYVNIVRDKSTLRKLMQATEDIRGTVRQPHKLGCDSILDGAEQRIFKISDEYHQRSNASLRKIGEISVPVNERIQELYERVAKGESPIIGTPTRFAQLDRVTSGLQSSDLIILAARPSVGKTAFALDILRKICSGSDHAAVLFSLEMSSEQIATRLIGMQGEIDQHQLRSCQMQKDGWSRYSEALEQIKEWRLWVDDTPSLTITELRSRARRLRRTVESSGSELSVIFVDYLQLMGADRSSEEDNRANQVSQISRGLKAIAREMNVPVVALSQLSRKIEDRRYQRPQLSDLRESGAIEQDADLVMFLSKPNTPDGPQERSSNNDEDVDLYIGKHRNGPTATLKFKFQKRYTRFEEVIEDPQAYYERDDQAGVYAAGDEDSYNY